MTNGPAFDEAARELIPHCSDIGWGVHLNVVEGRTVRRSAPRGSILYHPDGTFRLGFAALLRAGLDQTLLRDIEREFREQIERAAAVAPRLDHLNSHRHVHAIPSVFALVCQLAREYDIPYVRLARERPYAAGDAAAHLRGWYGANLLKLAILNALSRGNARTARSNGVRTNDWFVGTSYTGRMGTDQILQGLATLRDAGGVVEVLTHPARIVADRTEAYPSASGRDSVLNAARERDLKSLLDPSLAADLRRAGWRSTCYGCLAGAGAPGAHAHEDDREPERGPSRGGSQRPPLRTFVVIDETPLYHPEYLRRIITECEDLAVCGAAVVTLPRGGPLQRYVVRHARDIGYTQVARLALKTVGLRVIGRAPRFVRGDFDASVEAVLQTFGVPYRTVTELGSSSFLAWVQSFEPDVILSSNSLIFDERLLAVPTIACINRHSALLPAYGGVLPVFRALQKGERFTGASVHKMVREIDRGPVLARKWVPIFPTDTVDRLYRACFVVSFEATAEAARKLREGNADALPADGLEPSYYSFPTTADWREFSARKRRVI
jgi:methionyl-tRNA formyltransferase